MSEPQIPRLDPEQLREDRRKVQLGEAESGFDQVTNPNIDDVPATVGETAVGVVPPPR